MAALAQGLVPFLGRIALALFFLWDGWAKLTSWSASVQALAGRGVLLPQLVLPVEMAVELAGAAALVLGFRARLAAAALILLTFASLWYSHPSLAVAGEAGVQAMQFYKSLGLAGGLGYVLAFGAGQWSLDRG